jgi:hypothetical protein
VPHPSGFRDFDAFWPHYVREHRHPATRVLHFIGTHLALATVLAAGALHSPFLLGGAPLVAYGLAWIGHFFVEKNRPATFQHPLWSLRGDVRMLGLMWRGRMKAEVDRFTGRGSAS